MDEHKRRYEGWRVAAAGCLGVFFASLPFYVFSVFLKPLCDEFGWSREAAASGFSTMALMAAIFAPALGQMLDRVGRKRIVVPCLALSGAAVVSLSGMTNSLTHFYAVFAVLGVVTIGASPIAYSGVVFTWFTVRRGRALAVVLSGVALAAIVWPPAAQALIDLLGWRRAWMALGGLTLIVALPTVIRFVRERPSSDDAALVRSTGVSVRAVLGSRVFWTLVVVVFGSTIAMNGAMVHLSALLTDRGVPGGRAAIAVSAPGVGSLVGRLSTGWLLDRFPASRVSFAMLTIAALGTFLLAQAGSLTEGVVAATLMGIGTGGEYDAIPYLLARHFGLASIATLYGSMWTSAGIAGALGSALLGRAYDTFGAYETLLTQLALATLAVGALMLTLPPAPAPEDRAAGMR